MSGRKSRKQPLRGKLSHALEFPTDAMGGISCINVTGCHEMTVYRCECVETYEHSEIVLRLCDGTLRIEGEQMEMKTFASGVIRINGAFARITFGGTADA